MTAARRSAVRRPIAAAPLYLSALVSATLPAHLPTCTTARALVYAVAIAIATTALPARAKDAPDQATAATPAALRAPGSPTASTASAPPTPRTAPAATTPSPQSPQSPADRLSAAPVQSLDDLRDRLSQRIGATKAVDRKNVVVMQVAKPAGNDLEVSARTAPAHSVSPAAARTPQRTAGKPPIAKAVKAAAKTPQTHAPVDGPGAWRYDGDHGPHAWGTLQADFALCASGQRQSPIDIQGGIAVALEPVHFDYRAGDFSVIDTGHTVQVDLAPGSGISVLGRRYELLQFHFHRPSEERIDGRQFDMVVHLVHKDVDGRLAVVAVLLERGSAQSIVQTVWNNLPLEKHQPQAARVTLDPAALLPPDRRYYTYMGSLTTPPCSEGVLWMVLQQPVSIAPEQIDIFAKLYPMNARPVQATAGRLIKQSN